MLLVLSAVKPSVAAVDYLQFDIVGAQLTVNPSELTVPKDIPTFVVPEITLPEGAGLEAELAIAELTADAVVIAELRGPEIQPTVLSTLPGEPLNLPPFAVTGDYYLENIRLERDGEIILTSDPPSVRIKVIDDILVTSVETSQLSLEQIRELGLTIDDSSFSALEFSATFVIDGNQIPISFPVVIPRRPPLTPLSGAGSEIPLVGIEGNSGFNGTIVDLPPDLDLPGLNLYVVGAEFVPVEASNNEPRFSIPPIPALVAIPGNIGFLNSFFKATVIVQNGAPIGSGLTVIDIAASIELPKGPDQIAGTPDAPGDDPLRMARTETGVRTTVPIVNPGPDGLNGSPDDMTHIGPGQVANGEFLIEGLREGTHVFDIALEAVLEGLPAPVFLQASAAGLVQVKNATFSLTLSHPDTVAVGDDYSLFATITNTSDQIANLLSISLDPYALSGARLADGQSPRVEFETLPSGESVTAEFKMIAERTGSVTFSQIAADPGVTANFSLHGGVDERDVPLSPNTVVLPIQVNRLPPDLIIASQRVIGQAYSVATAPRLPAGVRYIRKNIVKQRGQELAAAGIEADFGLPLDTGLYNLTLDWLGNKTGDPGFEQLLRSTRVGDDWFAALGSAMEQEAPGQSILDLQNAFANATVNREPHLSVAFGDGVAPAPATVSITNNLGQRLAQQDGERGAGDLPFSQIVTFDESATGSRQLAVVGRVLQSTYTIELVGTGAGTTDLGIVLPGNDGELLQLRFPAVPLADGSRATIIVNTGSAAGATLHIDSDGNGSVDESRTPASTISILEAEPVALASRSVTDLSEAFGVTPHAAHFGLLVDVLFDQAVDPETAEDPANYGVDDFGVLNARLQAAGRVVTLLLGRPVGALVERQLQVAGVTDLRDQAMNPVLLEIRDRLGDGGQLTGQVQSANGQPLPGAIVQVFAFGPEGAGQFACSCMIADIVADQNGFYDVDFVRGNKSPFFQVRAHDSNLGQSVTVRSRVRMDGELLSVNPVFFGRGRVVGQVFKSDGVTPAGPTAVILTPDLHRTGLTAQGVYSDDNGVFEIENVPVGLFSLSAQPGTWVYGPAPGERHLQSTGEIAIVSGAVREPGETVELTIVTTDPLAPGTGDVRGRVFLSDGVSPAINYVVYLGNYNPLFDQVHALAQTFTDENGAYRFDDQPLGPWSAISVDPVTGLVVETAATVAAGDLTIANLVFGATGSARVVVRDPSGNLLQDGLVSGGFQLVPVVNGEAFIPEMPIGERVVAAGSSNPVRTGSNNVTIYPGQTSTVEIRLNPLADITGRVTDANGDPVPGALVRIPLPPAGYFKAESDEFGNYRFRNMGLDDYTVSAQGRNGEGIPLSDEEIAATIVDDASAAVRSGEVAAIRAAYQQALEVLYGVSDLQQQAGDATPGSFGFAEVSSFIDAVDAVADIQYLPTGSVGGITIDANTLPTKAAIEISGLTLDSFGSPVNRRIAELESGTVDGLFTYNGVAFADYTVKAAQPFSSAIISVNGLLTAGNPSDDDLVLQFPGDTSGGIAGIVYQPDGVTPVGENVPVETTFGGLTPQTHPDGTFDAQIPIPPGVYFLTATDPATSLSGQVSVSVGVAQQTFTEIRLLGRGSVRILVLRPDGSTVPNAEVEISSSAFPRETFAGFSGADGTVTFENVPEGPYWIVARDGVNLSGRGSVFLDQADVLAGRTVGASVTVRGFGSVAGVLLAAGTLEPIPDAQISLGVEGVAFVIGVGNVGAVTVTDAEGRFRYDEVPIGNFTATGVDPRSLRSGQTTGTLFTQGETVNITIVTAALGRVEGNVVAGNGIDPIAGASVRIVPAQLPIGTRQFPRITAADDGSFAYDGVPQGEYSLSASDPVSGFTGSTSGQIEFEGDTDYATIQILALGTITGIVYEADGVTPAINAEVSRPTIFGRASNQQGTDENGRYTMIRIPLGEYELIARELGNNNQPTQNGGETLVTVSEADEVVEADIVLNGTGQVEVTVVDANSVPVATADVVVRPHSTFGDELFGFTAADGTAIFDDVALGEFDVRAESSVLNVSGSASDALTSDGQQVSIEVPLGEAGDVFGRLVLPDTNSTPVPDARTTLRFQSQTQFIGVQQLFTNELGEFSFENIPVGTFTVEFDEPISTGVAFVDGSITFNDEQVDLGAIPLDLDAPRVVGSDPAEGANGVSEVASITLTFNEAIDPASVVFDNNPSSPNIDGNVYLVNGDGDKQTATVGVAPDGLSLTVVPDAVFASETLYQVGVTQGDGAIRDLAAGREVLMPFLLSFTVRDSVAPTLLSASPPDGAIGIEADAVLRFTFDESIDDQATIGLQGPSGPVSGIVTPLISDTVLVFTPDVALPLNGTYTYTVDQVADAAGNAYAGGPITGSFQTLDTQGPLIDSITVPAGPQVGGSLISAEAISSATDIATVVLSINGIPSATLSAPPYSISTVAPLVAGAVTFGAVATDTSGNIGPLAEVIVPIIANLPPTVSLDNSGGATTAGAGDVLEFQVIAGDELQLDRVVITAAGAFSQVIDVPLIAGQTVVDATIQMVVPADAPSAGVVSIQAAAFDISGFQASSAIVTLSMRDGIAPAVQFTTPVANAQVVAGSTLRVTIAANDDVAVDTVTLACAPALSGCGTQAAGGTTTSVNFDLAVPDTLLAPTVINLTASATDPSGNISTLVARNVRIADTVDPAQASVATANGLTRVLQNETVTLSATVSDNVGVSGVRFTLDGAVSLQQTVSVTPAAANSIVELPFLVPGAATDNSVINVSVVAIDETGNEGAAGLLQLTVGDTVPPEATVTLPVDGAAISPGDTFTLAVDASDDVGVRSIVWIVTGTFSDGNVFVIDPPQSPVSRSTTVTVPADAIPGPFTLEVFATDGVNPSTSQFVSGEVRDAVAPVATILSPADGTTIDPRDTLSVSVQATDNIGVTNVGVIASGALAANVNSPVDPAVTDVTRSLDLNFPTPPITGGSVTLAANAADAAGNNGNSTSITLTVLDVVAPAVTSIDPVDGASGVDPSTQVVIGFSEALDSATVNGSNFGLSIAGTPIAASVVLSDTQTVTITPAVPLAGLTTIDVNVSADVTDLAGNTLASAFAASFDTATDDVLGPQVTSTTPADAAAGVSVATTVTVRFDEALDPTTVNATTVSVSTSGGPVAGDLLLIASDTQARFTPSDNLPFATDVTIQVDPSITDIFGNGLRDAAGDPATAPLTFTFTTGSFALTSPSPGDRVIEGSSLALQSSASAGLGIVNVVYTVNGVDLAPAPAPDFVANFEVPSAAAVASLTIIASARGAGDVEIATDQVVVDVVPGLRVDPQLSGIPVGQTRDLQLRFTRTLDQDVDVVLTAIDPTIVGVPAGPVTLAAGEQSFVVPLSGIAEGNTTVVLDSALGGAGAVVSVGTPASGIDREVISPTTGITIRPVRNWPLIVPPSTQTTIWVPLLTSPAAATTPVTVVSTQPAIAAATGVSEVAAGSMLARVTIQAGTEGSASLVLSAHGSAAQIDVTVGTELPRLLRANIAPAAGLIVQDLAVRMNIVLSAGDNPSLLIPLLAAPAPGNTPVAVSSSDPSVADGSAVGEIPAGSQTILVNLTTGVAGVAEIRIEANGDIIILMVYVDTPPPDGLASILASPVGVAAFATDRIVIPTVTTYNASVQLLNSPAISALSVNVVSDDPAIAAVSVTPVGIGIGEQAAQISLNTGTEGETRIRFTWNGEERAITVIVSDAGDPQPDLLKAPDVGVEVQ